MPRFTTNNLQLVKGSRASQDNESNAIVAPGDARGDIINRLLSAASAAAVAEGPRARRTVSLKYDQDYLIDTPIVLPSQVRFDCDGAHLIPVGAGAADDVANCVIGATHTLQTSKMNTTLTVSVPKNSLTLTVVNAGTIAAGDWFAVEGHNEVGAPQDALGESTGADITFYEPMLVRSVSGNVITVAWPTRIHHGSTNCTVKAISPCRNSEIIAPRIWGSEDGALTAVGIYAKYAVGLEIRDVAISGMSRYAVDMVGAYDSLVDGYRNKGGSNGWLQATSCISTRVRDVVGDQDVDRFHASGYPRYPIMFGSRCTDIDVRDVHLTSSYAGFYVAGGEHVDIDNVDVTDVYITTAVYDRMVSSGELDNGAPLIVGLGTGRGPLAKAEFAWDVRIGRVRIEDVRAEYDGFWTATAPLRARAIYLHDVLNGHVGQASAINRGITGDTHIVSAIEISDFVGHIDSLAAAGMIYGLSFGNSANSVRIDRYDYKGGGGQSPNSTIPIFCAHTEPSAQAISLGYVSVANSSSVFRTGGSFAGDYRFRIDHLVVDGKEWRDCMIARNESVTSFSEGDVVELLASSTVNNYQRIVEPDTGDAAHERRLAAVASGASSDPGTGYMLVAQLPAVLATVKATTALVNKGGLIEYAATRRCAEDASAAHPFGKALDYKAAGSEGLIRVTLPSV